MTMFSRQRSVVIVACAALALPFSAAAQGDVPPRQGVCLYADDNYRGRAVCVGAGDELSSLPSDMSRRASSLRVYGAVEVTVFRDSRFRGRSTQFDGNVRSLKAEGWNDAIASIRVDYPSGQSRRRGSSQDPDRIVRRAYEDILDREPDQAGLRLYRSRIIDDGWTEAQVREALRSSPEYRQKNTMTRAKAEEIVRQAYLAVLKREPDAGSKGYVDKVLKDHWTQQRVEEELRKSPEYRKRIR